MGGGPRSTSGQTRFVAISFRTTEKGAQALDELRGDHSRSHFIRSLIAREARAAEARRSRGRV